MKNSNVQKNEEVKVITEEELRAKVEADILKIQIMIEQDKVKVKDDDDDDIDLIENVDEIASDAADFMGEYMCQNGYEERLATRNPDYAFTYYVRDGDDNNEEEFESDRSLVEFKQLVHGLSLDRDLRWIVYGDNDIDRVIDTLKELLKSVIDGDEYSFVESTNVLNHTREYYPADECDIHDYNFIFDQF